MRNVALSIGLVGAILTAGAPAPAQEGAPPGDGPLVHEGIVDAPVAEVWRVFTTGEGWKKLGVAKAEVDLRVGGLIRTHYSPEGVLGDESTIQNRILAFEPERMLAICVDKPPRGFPFKEAWKATWSVMTLTDLGDGRTHLRLAGLGYGADPESQAMRKFFLDGNAWTLKKLQSELRGAAKPGSPAGGRPAEGSLAPIVAEAVVPGARAEVFAAFTTAAGWKAFFGVDARIGAGPGEPFEILFDPAAPEGRRGSEGCVRLAHVAPEMFSFTWNAPPQFPAARAGRTWVVVDFDAPAAGLTRVRLRHLGFADQAAAHPEDLAEWERTRAYFAAAWPAVLGALREHFEEK